MAKRKQQRHPQQSMRERRQRLFLLAELLRSPFETELPKKEKLLVDAEEEDELEILRDPPLSEDEIAFDREDLVDEVGRSSGITYSDSEPLRLRDKESARDDKRWELDPASSEDYPARKKDLE